MPAGGLLNLRDGEPGEPEITLSPLRYHYQHRADIEAVVQGASRDTSFDTLCDSIAAVLAADRIGHHSAHWSDVWVGEHPSHPGWMFLKARLDLTGAPDVDGSFTLHGRTPTAATNSSRSTPSP